MFCAALEASHGLALKGVFLGSMWGLAEGGEAGGEWAWSERPGRASTVARAAYHCHVSLVLDTCHDFSRWLQVKPCPRTSPACLSVVGSSLPAPWLRIRPLLAYLSPPPAIVRRHLRRLRDVASSATALDATNAVLYAMGRANPAAAAAGPQQQQQPGGGGGSSVSGPAAGVSSGADGPSALPPLPELPKLPELPGAASAGAPGSQVRWRRLKREPTRGLTHAQPSSPRHHTLRKTHF